MENINVLSEVYQSLEKALNFFNERAFNSEFKQLVFVIQGEKATAKGTYGTQWAEKWQAEDTKLTEISLSAENLRLDDINRIFITIVHELVHERAHLKKIKDTSRNGRFHNKRFAELAEMVGLVCEKDSKSGYRTESATDALMKIFNECYALINGDSLYKNMKRLHTTTKPKSTTNLVKYVCPMCGSIARAKMGAYLICGECDERMREE